MTGALAGKTISQISAAGLYAVVLTSDNLLFAWGQYFGLSPVAVALGAAASKTLSQLSSGYQHTLLLASDGTVFAFGLNNVGQLGVGAQIGLTQPILVPTAVNTSGVLKSETITQISGGYQFSLVLASDGTLYSWGSNLRGQLGDGTATNQPLPVAVNMAGALAGKTITQISGGRINSAALSSDGMIFMWGGNFNGQLGNGTTAAVLTPIPNPQAVNCTPGGSTGTTPGGSTGTTPGGSTGTTPGGSTGTTPGGSTGTTPGGSTGTAPGGSTGTTPGNATGTTSGVSTASGNLTGAPNTVRTSAASGATGALGVLLGCLFVFVALMYSSQ